VQILPQGCPVMTDQNLGTGIILCKIDDPNSFFIINMGISSLLMNMEPPRTCGCMWGFL
jgi:hypothetical protein